MSNTTHRLRRKNRRLAYKIKLQAAQINNLVAALAQKLNPMANAPHDGEWVLVSDIDSGRVFAARFDLENGSWEAIVGGWFEEQELRGWVSLPDSCEVKQPYRELLEGGV